MKKLDRLILTAFLGPFLVTFFLSLLAFTLQFFWLYIDELVGKGLEFRHLVQLYLYITALSVSYSLPLAILIASIMAYGRMSETSELVAMKAAGFSFGRVALPIGIISFFLVGVAFLFNDQIIPQSNLKITTMRYDIISSKPAFDIEEGVFYDKLDGFVLNVAKKGQDNKRIEGVLIYQQQEMLRHDDDLIVAKFGDMNIIGNSDYLELVLKDGWYYQASPSKSKDKQQVRFHFDKYTKLFPLWSFETQSSDSLFQHSINNKGVAALQDLAESSSQRIATLKAKLYGGYLEFNSLAARLADSSNTFRFAQVEPTSPLHDATYAKLYIQKNKNLNHLRASAVKYSQYISQTDYMWNDLRYYQQQRRKSEVAIHKKYVISAACFLFFMLGAPIGSIIKKGGIGLPLVLAVIIFTVFHFGNTFGAKYSQEIGGPDTFWSQWIIFLALFVIGTFLFVRISDTSLKKYSKKK